MPKREQFATVRKYPLFWELIRGRRTSIGNRWLSAMWPSDAEARQTFTPRYAYLNHIGPGDIAGNHFHSKKEEFFCPLGDLVLVLYDRKKKRRVIKKIHNRNKRQFTMYYIKPGVPHAVINRTRQFQALVVLTNRHDARGDSVDFIVTK